MRKKKMIDPNFSQSEFAKKVGVSEAALSLLVNNKSLPMLPAAYKISRELEMLVEEIWIVEDEKTRLIK